MRFRKMTNSGSIARRRRRTYTIGAATLAVSQFAVGGASAAVLPRAASKSITLTVQAFSNNIETLFVQPAIKAFEADHPSIHVQVDIITNAFDRGPNVSVLTSSSPPDVGFIQRGTGEFVTLMKDNAIIPIDGVAKQDNFQSDMNATAKELYSLNGNWYGVGDGGTFLALAYYNKDAFRKAHIAVPSSHIINTNAQLYAMVAKLKSAGYEGLGEGGQGTYELGNIVDYLLPTATTPSQFHNYLTNYMPRVPLTASYATGPFLRVLQTLDAWEQHGVFPPGVVGTSDAAAQAAFAAGRTAMYDSGSWVAGELPSFHLSFPVGWLLLPPVVPGRAKMVFYSGDMWIIPRNAPHVAAAKAFLQELGSERWQQSSVLQAGSIPDSTAVPVADVHKWLPVLDSEMIAESKALGVAASAWDISIAQNMRQAFEIPLLQKLLDGTLTPQEVAETYQRQLLRDRSTSQ